MNTVLKTSDEATGLCLPYSILVNFILFQAKPRKTLWVCLHLCVLNSQIRQENWLADFVFSQYTKNSFTEREIKKFSYSG